MLKLIRYALELSSIRLFKGKLWQKKLLEI